MNRSLLSFVPVTEIEVAVICALSILLFIRANQVWTHSHELGYTNARAARLKGWLVGWAGAGLFLALIDCVIAWFPLGLLESVSERLHQIAGAVSARVMAIPGWRLDWRVVVTRANQLISPYSLPQVEIGIICGLAVLLLVRASQVWTLRKNFAFTDFIDYKVARLQRWLRKRAGFAFCLALVGAGVYWFVVFYHEPVMSAAQVAVLPSGQQVTRVIIPVLGLESVMLEAPIVGWEWDVSTLTDEVGHLEGTPEPGQLGNSVIAGHSTDEGGIPGPFFELSQVRVGDYIYVEQGEVTLKYEVVEIRRVEPEDVAAIYQDSPYSQLSLLTCDAYSITDRTYSKRLIIVSRLIG